MVHDFGTLVRILDLHLRLLILILCGLGLWYDDRSSVITAQQLPDYYEYNYALIDKTYLLKLWRKKMSKELCNVFSNVYRWKSVQGLSSHMAWRIFHTVRWIHYANIERMLLFSIWLILQMRFVSHCFYASHTKVFVMLLTLFEKM